MTRTSESELPLLPTTSSFAAYDDDSNPIERYYNYFMKESDGDPIPFGKKEAGILGLESLGASAGIYYWPSAWAYSKDKAPALAYWLTLSNPVTGVIFLAKATDDFFELMSAELSAPQELSNISELPSRKALIIKYAVIFIGALLCAAPFGISTYLFPPSGCEPDACLSTIVSHSSAANIILHAVSWAYMLNFWYYRIPFLPFEYAYQAYKNKKLTPAQKKIQDWEQQKAAIYQKYKNLVTQFFATQFDYIVNDHIEAKTTLPKAHSIQGSSNPGDDPIDAATQASASVETLAENARNAQEDKSPDIVPAASPSCAWQVVTAAHHLMKKGGASILGAVTMTFGCIGWVANPIWLGLDEGLSWTESIFAGFLPAYSMGVLAAFYGSICWSQVYDFLTSSWDNLRNKLPFEARLFPKTFTFFLLLNAALSLFSYATAEQLIITIFDAEAWDELRPHLENNGIVQMDILCIISLLNLFNTLIRRCVAKFGAASPDQAAARFLAKSEALRTHLQYIKGEALMAGLAKYLPEQTGGAVIESATLTAMKIDTAEFIEDLAQIKTLDQRIQNDKSAMTSSAESKEAHRSLSITQTSGKTPQEQPGELYISIETNAQL